MSNYYLAIDIGASSGRHILGSIENGEIQIEEIHRFENKLHQEDGYLCWDYSVLFDEILEGLRKAKTMGKVPSYIGIDTWAVDFVLLDGEDGLTTPMISYRDNRTKGLDEAVNRRISYRELYQRTGIQKQIFNSIYQLIAAKRDFETALDDAEAFLMVPDYFNYLLTGIQSVEYTNATSTGIVSIAENTWDDLLLEELGIPRRLFGEISEPGTILGPLQDEIVERIGYSAQVVLPATHDTASAIMAVPSLDENDVYISSGTWSLFGTETKTPIVTEEAFRLNFTNEGGYGNRICFLKNIMGMWLLQSIRRELEERDKTDYGFDQLAKLAMESSIESVIDCSDARYFAPESMIAEILSYLDETDQRKPATVGELAYIIYHSLALSYAKTLRELESITQLKYEKIYIVGGGAQAELLNQLTADKTKCTIFAGPVEATALGNLGVQMIASGELKDTLEFRKLIAKSFEIKVYKGENR